MSRVRTINENLKQGTALRAVTQRQASGVVQSTSSAALAQETDALIFDELAGGTTGPAGASAYEVAVANGFVGTEAAWLASLVGADGDPGPEGPPGPAGSSIKGVAIVTLPNGVGVREWTETVSATGVLPANIILCALAPALDTQENDPEMLDLLSLSALAGTDQIEFTLVFAENASGPIRLNWSAF